MRPRQSAIVSDRLRPVRRLRPAFQSSRRRPTENKKHSSPRTAPPASAQLGLSHLLTLSTTNLLLFFAPFCKGSAAELLISLFRSQPHPQPSTAYGADELAAGMPTVARVAAFCNTTATSVLQAFGDDPRCKRPQQSLFSPPISRGSGTGDECCVALQRWHVVRFKSPPSGHRNQCILS